jgi:hypothetical protein
MTNATLALLGLTAVGLLAFPTASAGLAGLAPTDSAGDAACDPVLGWECAQQAGGGEDAAATSSVCRPYNRPPPIVRGYCTVQGSERAVAMFLDNATAGNYTTVQELVDGAVLMKSRIEACVNDPANQTCPTRLHL